MVVLSEVVDRACLNGFLIEQLLEWDDRGEHPDRMGVAVGDALGDGGSQSDSATRPT